MVHVAESNGRLPYCSCQSGGLAKCEDEDEEGLGGGALFFSRVSSTFSRARRNIAGAFSSDRKGTNEQRRKEFPTKSKFLLKFTMHELSIESQRSDSS